MIQFIGFLVGGLGAFRILLGHPVCAHCKKYLRVLAKSDKLFGSANDLASYHDTLFQLPVDSPQFAEMARAEHKAKVEKGTWKQNLKLYGCPECKAQTIGGEVSVWNGKDWKSVNELARKFSIPPGIDLAGVFMAKTYMLLQCGDNMTMGRFFLGIILLVALMLILDIPTFLGADFAEWSSGISASFLCFFQFLHGLTFILC